MIREITFPIETCSENVYRRMHHMAVANKTAKQREDTTNVLEENFVRCAVYLPGWVRNRFVVTFCRISPAPLDDDNIRGALKAVRDAVAKWIGLDDRDPYITFQYLQQRCTAPYQGLRITIKCNEQRPDVRHVKAPYPVIRDDPEERPTRKEKPNAKPAPKRSPKQEVLSFLPAYAALPWKHLGDGEYDLQLLEGLGDDPPYVLTFRRKGTTDEATLKRRRFHHEELGECWLYGP